MKEKEQVDTYFQKGSLFENLVIAELLKKEYHQGQIPSFYFWRDNTGNEMDLLVENFQSIDAWEMKSGATVNPDYFKGFNYLNKIEGLSIDKKRVVYGGNIPQLRNGIEVIGWYNIS